jgi:Flp pilus assembly protein TadD
MENMLARAEVDTATANPTTEFQARVDEALGRNPPDPEVLHQLGLEADRTGDVTQALALLSRAAEVDSSKAVYFVSIARLLASEDMFNQAALAYLLAQERAADDPGILTELAAVLRKGNRETEALAVLRQRDGLGRL